MTFIDRLLKSKGYGPVHLKHRERDYQMETNDQTKHEVNNSTSHPENSPSVTKLPQELPSSFYRARDRHRTMELLSVFLFFSIVKFACGGYLVVLQLANDATLGAVITLMSMAILGITLRYMLAHGGQSKGLSEVPTYLLVMSLEPFLLLALFHDGDSWLNSALLPALVIFVTNAYSFYFLFASAAVQNAFGAVMRFDYQPPFFTIRPSKIENLTPGQEPSALSNSEVSDDENKSPKPIDTREYAKSKYYDYGPSMIVFMTLFGVRILLEYLFLFADNTPPGGIWVRVGFLIDLFLFASMAIRSKKFAAVEAALIWCSYHAFQWLAVFVLIKQEVRTGRFRPQPLSTAETVGFLFNLLSLILVAAYFSRSRRIKVTFGKHLQFGGSEGFYGKFLPNIKILSRKELDALAGYHSNSINRNDSEHERTDIFLTESLTTAQRLENLKALQDKGLLSSEEYQSKRQSIIDTL
jgi:hypothetical protein